MKDIMRDELGAPKVVDRATYQAELDTLRVRDTFANEMQAAAVDFQVVLYGGAMHGFTNPAADRIGRPGVAYHAQSDFRSWAAMRQFLAELFGS